MPVAKGLLLWLRHVLDAEAHSRFEVRSIFTWSEFKFGLAQPLRQDCR